MLALLFSKRLVSNLNYVEISNTHLTYLLCNAHVPLSKPFSTIKLATEEDKKVDFTLSYLKNSCGLSQDSAVTVSKYVKFMSPEKPDAVIRVLKDHGFNDTNISRLVKKLPDVLLSKPHKTLLPKLEFLQSIGVSHSELADIICLNPIFLNRSLQNQIIPFYNVLKKFITDDRKVVKVFSSSSWIFTPNAKKNIVTNSSILKKHGVAPSIVSQLLVCYPSSMTLNPEKFSDSLKKIIELGFSLHSSVFGRALLAFSQMSKSTWERKMNVYRSLGWSDDEFWLAFRRHPVVIQTSEKKIVTVVDFLVKKMGWKPSDVAKVPTVFSYSMVKRTIPRCSVIKILVFEGLVEQISLASAVTSPEQYFLKRFVIKYMDRLPYLLTVFQGKKSIEELGLGFDG